MGRARALNPVWRSFVPAVVLCLAGVGVAGAADASQAAAASGGDQMPVLSVTSGLPGCPVPQRPRLSAQQVRELAHQRTQHGVSCYRSGRCRLPNSYLYDAEIIPRVRQFILADGRFADTSVWVLGERRLVTLMGCVARVEQAQALERAVAQVDDVVGVINLLQVGVAAPPRYPAAPRP